MRLYSTIFTINILAGLVSLTTIGCTKSATSSLPQTAPAIAHPAATVSQTVDRAESPDQPRAITATTLDATASQSSASNTASPSMTADQAIATIAELPEIIAWKAYIKEKTDGKVRAALIINPETPTMKDGQQYWAVSFYESQSTHSHRWQSFLVRLDGQEILVDDIEGKYRHLETWRQQDQPMARVGQPNIESAPDKLPFVGTKRFNFLGGSGTGQSITIAADGQTIIKLHGTMDTIVQYSGAFTNPIVVENGYGLLFQDNKVYRTAPDGQIIKSCDGQATCETPLY
jgi:hypothetical protein